MPDARSSVTTSKTNELRQDCYTHVNHEKLKPGAKGLAHNWFDGIHTFIPYICHKSWLGGWLMPQQKSYFAILLPKRWWWVFGLDLVLHGDIDVYKFKFFYELISEKVEENDFVHNDT